MANLKSAHQFREPTRFDPYRETRKPAGLASCKDCGAVCLRGRWISEAEYQRHFEMKVQVQSRITCPACLKLKFHYAQGVVELIGNEWLKSRAAVLNTLRRTERIFRGRNDQSRILWFGEDAETRNHPAKFKVYVTQPELARHLGRELHKSFKGTTHISRSREEPFVRVRWDAEGPTRRIGRGHLSRAFRKRGA